MFILRCSTMALSGSGIARSSTGQCSALPWKTVSTELSLTGNKEPSLIKRGPLAQASSIVRPLGRNLGR